MRESLILNFYTGDQNAFMVKRKTGGGVRFSRDPFNVMNIHSRKVMLLARELRDMKLILYQARRFHQRQGTHDEDSRDGKTHIPFGMGTNDMDRLLELSQLRARRAELL